MALSLTAGAITNVAIYGGSTGAIAATTITGGTSPFTAAWTVSSGATAISDNSVSGSTVPAKTGLKAGTYTLTVTDSATTPATATHAYSITQATQLAITTARRTHTSTSTSADGAVATVTISGGTSPYTAAWTSSTGATSPLSYTVTGTTVSSISELEIGTYTLTVTDHVGATASRAFSIVVQTYEGLTITPGNIAIHESEGSYFADISATTFAGGDGDYTVSWVSETHGPRIIDESLGAKMGLHHGVYKLTVVDGTGSGAIHKYVVPEKKRMYRHSGGGYSHDDPLQTKNVSPKW